MVPGQVVPQTVMVRHIQSVYAIVYTVMQVFQMLSVVFFHSSINGYGQRGCLQDSYHFFGNLVGDHGGGSDTLFCCHVEGS